MHPTWPDDPAAACARLAELRRARGWLYLNVLGLPAPFLAVLALTSLRAIDTALLVAVVPLCMLPWTTHRFQRLACPRCGESFMANGRRPGQWFGSPLFSRCGHCDLAIDADRHCTWPGWAETQRASGGARVR